jgi:hypothetical protein
MYVVRFHFHQTVYRVKKYSAPSARVSNILLQNKASLSLSSCKSDQTLKALQALPHVLNQRAEEKINNNFFSATQR